VPCPRTQIKRTCRPISTLIGAGSRGTGGSCPPENCILSQTNAVGSRRIPFFLIYLENTYFWDKNAVQINLAFLVLPPCPNIVLAPLSTLTLKCWTSSREAGKYFDRTQPGYRIHVYRLRGGRSNNWATRVHKCSKLEQGWILQCRVRWKYYLQLLQ